MEDITRLVVTVADALTTRRRPEPGRLAGIALAVALALSGAVAAVGCALAALWIYAEPHAGRAGAPLLVAGVLLALVLAALAMAWALRKPRHQPPGAGAAAELLLAEMTRLTRVHEGPMLLAALVAGIAVGARGR